MSASDFSGYARGWFVVCFSDEIASGATRPLRYFGEDLVAFRGADGQVRVLEAHCAHMGAHLGVGGTVVDCAIQCPFHGWRYDGSGACVAIPYATKIPPKARQRAWRVREVNGVVLVYHDPFGGEPDFDIPSIPEYGSADWLPWSRSFYHVKTHPREIIDNHADRAHFAFVHKTEMDDFSFEVDGVHCTQNVKGRSFFADGRVDTFQSTTTYHGPGYLLMRMTASLNNYMLVAHTPVDERSLDLRLAVTLQVVGDRQRTERIVPRFLDNLKRGFEDDLQIWENKVYRDPAILCDGDGPIGKIRKWYRQFYEPAGGAR